LADPLSSSGFLKDQEQVMPIYEYLCSACDHRLETIQRFSDPPLKKCPECGKARLKKLISAVGFRLSGKGWYETDFKNDEQRNLSRKDSAEESKTVNGKDSAGSKQGGAKTDGAGKAESASKKSPSKKASRASAAANV